MNALNTPNTSRAFTVGKTESGWARKIVNMPIDQLGEGDVLVQVEYSGINFKDGLASTESGRIARIDPLIGGVDLAGKVVESSTQTSKSARALSATAMTSASLITAGFRNTHACNLHGLCRCQPVLTHAPNDARYRGLHGCAFG